MALPPLPAGFEAEPLPPLPEGFEIEGAESAPSASEDYNEGLRQRIASGASLPDLEAYLKQQGVDPAAVKNLAENVAYRDSGGRSPIRVISADGVTQVEPEQSVGRSLALGAGDIVQGVAGLAGLVTNPINAALNWTGIPQALTGSELGTDLGQAARDAFGAPSPVTDVEKLTSAVVQGGAGGLATAGIAGLATGASGATGNVARELASNPVRDIIAGLTGGAGAEAGHRIGGTPGAIIGGIVGGVAGATGAAGASRLAERAAEAVASRFPRAVIMDEAGALTEEGREIALRVGTNPEEVRNSYARVRSGSVSPRNSTSATREAARANRPTMTSERYAELTADRPQAAPVDGQAATDALDARTARIVEAMQPQTQASRFNDGPFPNRFAQAESEGVQLSRGQAEQDFAVYNDEQGLKVSATSEGNQAREFFATQVQQVKDARDRFLAAFGDVDATPADRGAAVQQAVSDLRDGGAEGVRNLYRAAEELGGDALTLDTNGIRQAATDVLIDEAVPEAIKRSVSQELARYGIVGEAQPMNEVGLTRVLLDDGSSVTFRGPVKQLTASNADEMRKAINRLYNADPTHASQSIKPAIDDALEAALERAAGSPEGQIGDAYRAARDAHRTQRQTFHAKDIIESLHASKKGTNTPVLLPERAIAQVIGSGPKGISNLRQVKALLLSSRQPSAQQGWQAIKQQALADIFGGATTRTTNVGGEITDAISGPKLRTQIHDKVGVAKLRVLLDDDEFNQLMKLSRIIGDTTVPMGGTTNPSGTFTKLVNYLGKGALKFTGGFGDAAVALAGKAKDLATTRKTLQGITSYNGDPAEFRRIDQQARDFIRQYIEDGQAGRLVPTGINLSAQGGGNAQNQ